MLKPINSLIYQNSGTFGTAAAFTTEIDQITIGDLKSFRVTLFNSATGTINVNLQVAPFNSHSDSNLTTWTTLPSTTVDLISSIATDTVDHPVCAVDMNTWEFLRVQCRITATGVTATIGSLKLVLTGERK